MKQFIFSLIALLILGSATAQIQYESPHVKDGKTIQFTLPKGFFKIANSDYEGNTLFTTKEGVDYDEVDTERENIAMLAVLHESTEERTLEQIIDELQTDLIEANAGLIVLAEPKIIKMNGRECMVAGFKGDVEGDEMSAIYFSVTVFGDFNVVIAYYALQGIEDELTYEGFKKIMASWKEVATTREDEMPEFDNFFFEEEGSEMDDEIEETNYINDLIETDISAYDILPDFGDNWDMPYEENSHLLSEFVFKKEHGTVKVFSGGQFSNYPTDKEKAAAIQLVMDLPSRLGLKGDSKFSNEDHFFQLYTISGGGTLTSVYTTIVNKELVFFLIDGGSDPLPDFKPAVRDFMLTMWVDYFEGEEEEIEPEETDPRY